MIRVAVGLCAYDKDITIVAVMAALIVTVSAVTLVRERHWTRPRGELDP
jgi:hypothetical protein